MVTCRFVLVILCGFVAVSLSVGCRAPTVPSGAKPEQSRVRILFAGDTSFGENYQVRRQEVGKENILDGKGYDHPLEKLKPLLLRSDLVIANLETPITDFRRSPLADKKTYVHWSDVRKAPAAFQHHNMRVFSLANNHAMDYGAAGLEQTLRVLKTSDLEWFGAGRNEGDAGRPWRQEIRTAEHVIPLVVIGGYTLNTTYDREYSFYARGDSPGVHALTAETIVPRIRALKQQDPRSFVVVFPHWGRNYRWKDRSQTELAHLMIEAGADLILGHGAHMLQEIELYEGRWIVYSIGNFMFNSEGRYDKLGAPPFSLAAELLLVEDQGELKKTLRLYPIFTNNRVTGFQSRFVTDEEFDEVHRMLGEKSWNRGEFAAKVRTGEDAVGRFLEVTLE